MMTHDDTSNLLRLILAEKFPTLTGVHVTSHRNWRNTPDKDVGFFLWQAEFESIGRIHVGVWFDVGKMDVLIEDLGAKLRRRTKYLEDKAAGRRRIMRRARILAYIARRGEAGARFSEIQRFAVEKIHGLNWDQRDIRGRRRYRGYLCEYLLLILPEFCFKEDDGRWRIKPTVKIRRYKKKGFAVTRRFYQ